MKTDESSNVCIIIELLVVLSCTMVFLLFNILLMGAIGGMVEVKRDELAGAIVLRKELEEREDDVERDEELDKVRWCKLVLFGEI